MTIFEINKKIILSLWLLYVYLYKIWVMLIGEWYYPDVNSSVEKYKKRREEFIFWI